MERPTYGITSTWPPFASELPNETRIGYKLFEANFHPGDLLGSGANGDVTVWTRKRASNALHGLPKEIAVKTVTVKLLNRKHLKSEIKTLSELEPHENILKFYGYFVCSDVRPPCTKEVIGIITELCSGTLYDIILYHVEHKFGQRTLKHYEVARIIKQLLAGIRHLHNNSVIHRDIKPSNILLVTPEKHINWQRIDTSQLTVKLGDFGLSNTYETADSMSFVGTFPFIAPEVRQASGQLRRIPADKSVDIWAAGLVAIMLLSAKIPPAMTTVAEISAMTRDCYMKPIFQENIHFLSFLSMQIQIEPSKRSSAEQLLSHPYVMEMLPLRGDISRAIETHDTTYIKQLMQMFDYDKPKVLYPLITHAASCSHYDYIEIMVERFDPGIDDISKALLDASYKGNKSIIEYLINQGGNINIKGRHGWTPLMMASQLNNLDLVQFLTKDPIRADVSIKDDYGMTALHWASQGGHLAIVQHLIQIKMSSNYLDSNVNVDDPWSDRDNEGMTELHHACYMGHKDVVEYLVCEAKADITKTAKGKSCSCKKDRDIDWNPLHFACTLPGNLLLDSGNVTRNTTCTKVYVVDFLLTTAAMDVHARTKKGKTPFLIACCGEDLETVKYLAEKAKADTHATDNAGRNAIHCSACSHNTDPVLMGISVKGAWFFDESASKHALYEAMMSYRDRINVIEYLVGTCQVDACATDYGGRNALQYAAMSWPTKTNAIMHPSSRLFRHLFTVRGDERYFIIRYLVENCHVDVSVTDKKGRNAIYYLLNGMDVVKCIEGIHNFDISSIDEASSSCRTAKFYPSEPDKKNIEALLYLVDKSSADTDDMTTESGALCETQKLDKREVSKENLLLDMSNEFYLQTVERFWTLVDEAIEKPTITDIFCYFGENWSDLMQICLRLALLSTVVQIWSYVNLIFDLSLLYFFATRMFTHWIQLIWGCFSFAIGGIIALDFSARIRYVRARGVQIRSLLFIVFELSILYFFVTTMFMYWILTLWCCLSFVTVIFISCDVIGRFRYVYVRGLHVRPLLYILLGLSILYFLFTTMFTYWIQTIWRCFGFAIAIFSSRSVLGRISFFRRHSLFFKLQLVKFKRWWQSRKERNTREQVSLVEIV